MRSRLAALLLLAAALAPGACRLPGSTPPHPRRVMVPAPVDVLLRVNFRGGDAVALPAARGALARVFETDVGRKARELLESGTLAGPLTIELNGRGDNFTHYRWPGGELGERIAFDPSSRPLVDTDGGLLPAEPESVIAHELGHAVFKLVSEEAVIQAVENPVRAQLGLPLRSRF